MTITTVTPTAFATFPPNSVSTITNNTEESWKKKYYYYWYRFFRNGTSSFEEDNVNTN